jgi:uncharacterized protein (TIGR02466 family)
MTLENIFPIPLIKLKIDSSVVDHTLTLVNDFIKTTGFTNSAPPDHLLTTFYNDKNFLGNINDIALINIINTASRDFFKILGYDPDCFTDITSWLQFNQSNSHFIRHEHYGSLVSGVVYLQTPKNCGNIVFHNPLETRRTTAAFFGAIKQKDNPYNFDQINVSPVKGEMILFESWLPHSVEQNLSLDNRISISFNVWANKHGLG